MDPMHVQLWVVAYLWRSGRRAPDRRLSPSCTAGLETAAGRTRPPCSVASRSSDARSPAARPQHTRWSSPLVRTCRPSCDRSAPTSPGWWRRRQNRKCSPSPTGSSRAPPRLPLLRHRQRKHQNHHHLNYLHNWNKTCIKMEKNQK